MDDSPTSRSPAGLDESDETAHVARARMFVPWLLAVAVVVLVGWALKATAPVAIPLTFAILVTLVIAPLDIRLARALPDKLRWVAHVAVMMLILGILAFFFAALVFAADRLLEALPGLTDRVEAFLPDESGGGGETAGEGSASGEAPVRPSDIETVWRVVSGRLSNWAIDQATVLATATASLTGTFLSAVVLVFFLILVALTEIDDWRSKVTANWAGKGADKVGETVAAVTSKLCRFLLVRTAVGLLQGALYVGWLALFDVDLLIVWGVLTFVLTYIPTLGSLISGALPVLYALLTKDFGTALAVGAGIFAIEQIVGNYIDPRLMGRQIVLSPLVILASLLFWGWLWGAAGAFLATPLTLSLLVACHEVGPLRPVALLLSNQPDHASLDASFED